MDLVTFGSTFLELVFGHVDHLPVPGEEIFTDEFAISCGGGAVTVATTAQRGGVQAAVCTVLGGDLGSQVVSGHCQREGVDLSPSLRVPGRAAGITVVLNFDNDRAFISHLPHPTLPEEGEVDRWRAVLRRERPAWAYFHAGPGILPLMHEAQQLGISVALDASYPPIDGVREEMVECARLATVCVPNEPELRGLAGGAELADALDFAASWGTDVVVKRGAAGAVVVQGGRATPVTDGLLEVEVRDRTGAGDSFAGAMIAALAQGASLAAAAAAGNTAGSLAVARLGAVGEVEVEGLSVVSEALGSLPWWAMPAAAGGPAPTAGAEPGPVADELDGRARDVGRARANKHEEAGQ